MIASSGISWLQPIRSRHELPLSWVAGSSALLPCLTLYGIFIPMDFKNSHTCPFSMPKSSFTSPIKMVAFPFLFSLTRNLCKSISISSLGLPIFYLVVINLPPFGCRWWCLLLCWLVFVVGIWLWSLPSFPSLLGVTGKTTVLIYCSLAWWFSLTRTKLCSNPWAHYVCQVSFNCNERMKILSIISFTLLGWSLVDRHTVSLMCYKPLG